jgi:hypothetical protein
MFLLLKIYSTITPATSPGPPKRHLDLLLVDLFFVSVVLVTLGETANYKHLILLASQSINLSTILSGESFD